MTRKTAPGLRAYRVLLRLLPRELRMEWGREMEALLARRLEAAGAGPQRVVVWARAVADVAVQAVAVRAGSRRAHRRAENEMEARRRPGAGPGADTGGSAEGRGGGGMDGVRQDLRYAWRTVRRSPGHAAAVVATLALGIGAPVAVFSVVDGVLLQPPPYRDADELVFLNGPVMDLEPAVWRDAPPVFTDLARWGLGAGTAVSAGTPRRVSLMAVEAGFFEVLGVDAERGRLLAIADDRESAVPVAVVSDRYRRITWGEDASPAGRTVELDGRVFEVVGSLPPGFVFFRYEDADLWIPLAHHRRGRTPSGLARLAPGVDPAAATDALEAFARSRSDDPEAAGGPRVRLVGVRESLVGELRAPLLVFMGAGALVLLIAVANAANLLLARGIRRRHELAVRQAVGAGRGRLVRQLVLEAGLLSAAAAAVGVVLATGATAALLRLSADVVPEAMDVGVDHRVLAFAAGVALLATLGAGLTPAFLALGGRAGAVGGRTSTTSRSGRTFESGLVALEMALTLVLLVASGVLLRTFLELRPTDPGFVVEGRVVVSFDLPRHRYPDGQAAASFVDQVLPRLAALPGVERAEAVSNLPLTGLTYYVPATSDAVTEGPSGRPTFIHLRSATEDYLDLMGMAPLRGRLAAGPDEVVVNESAVRRFWPDDASPLGRTLSTTGTDTPRPLRVVGVVADTRIFGGVTEGRPEAFVRFDAEPLPRFHVVLASSRPVERNAVRRAVDDVDAGVPVLEVASLADLIAPSNRVPRFQTTLVGTLALLALLLAALGTFAVLSHAAARRTREVGIRVALGAGRGQVVGTVLRGGLAPAAAGLCLGLLLSLLAQGLMERTFLLVRSVEPQVIAGAVAALAATALVAALHPALRASSVDPATVLRQE